ncbi:MAG TPA: prohibitin family protein [Dehalococcoidia bacterium]|nr:prohibitin family protein [Dehalococcoidia bacterium]
MIGLLILGIIGIVIGYLLWQTSRGSKGDPTKDPSLRFWGIAGVFLGVVLVVGSVIFGSFTTIPAGQRGVVIRFGAITGNVLGEGLKTKVPFLDSVVKMSVQTQKYEAASTAASRDLQEVKTAIALNWRLDPSLAADVYKTLGLEYIDRIAAPAIQETIKQVTARYNAEDLILKREEVKGAISESLAARLLERGIIAETVSITDFQFSATFIAAIEAKVAAEQSVLESKNKLERVKVEAQQREAVEQGEAAARIAKAQGEAEYIRIVTDAQVAANTAIAGSLTPEVLQYILLDRLGEDIKVMVIPSGQGLSLVLPELKP